MHNMEYLLLLLAVVAVFADPLVDTSFKANQQEKDNLLVDNQQKNQRQTTRNRNSEH